MEFNIVRENVMKEIQDNINKAIIEYDPRVVDFYHLMKQYVETHEIIQFLKRLNQPSLRSLITYLNDKMRFLEEKMTSYEILFE